MKIIIVRVLREPFHFLLFLEVKCHHGLLLLLINYWFPSWRPIARLLQLRDDFSLLVPAETIRDCIMSLKLARCNPELCCILVK